MEGRQDWNMNQNKNEGSYLLADSAGVPLTNGWLESFADSDEIKVRVPEDKIPVVLKHQEIHLIGAAKEAPALFGAIVRHEGDVIVLKKWRDSPLDLRQSLRVPIRFDTFLYPVNGGWTGRCKIESHDLSGGGIAFFCDRPFEKGERVEVVIPVTSKPLILQCEILRQRATERDLPFYAAKFVEMCDEEETMVCEAVFSAQIEQRGRKRA